MNPSFPVVSRDALRAGQRCVVPPCAQAVSRAVRVGLRAGAAALLLAQALPAQDARNEQVERMEAALVRVRRMTTSDVAGARVLADSLVRALPDAEPAQAEALFARASVAGSAAEAEQDYERLVLAHPLSGRVPDALMRLAVLESARGDRGGALRHLDRLLREYGDSPPRARASLLAARLRLDANDVARACDHLGAAYAASGPTERDVQDQAVRLGERCPVPPATMARTGAAPLGVTRGTVRETAPPSGAGRPPARATTPVRDTARRTVARNASAPGVRETPVAPPVPSLPPPTAAAPRASTPAARTESVPAAMPSSRAAALAPSTAAPSAAAPSTAAPSAAAPSAVAPSAPAPSAPARAPAPPVVAPPAPVTAAPSGAGYAVQFAAYNTKVGAQGFVAQLRARGIPARVEGEVAPFRVRAGRYPSRAEAEIAAQGWRTPGQAAIVVGYGGAP